MAPRMATMACAVALIWGCDGPDRATPSDGMPTDTGSPDENSGTDQKTGVVFGAARLQSSTLVCFYAEEDPKHPAAMIEHRLEVTEGADSLHARLTLDPRFVDNTYGANAIGWDAAATAGGKKPKAREFDQLVGSDHAVLRMLDSKGKAAIEFKFDYISEDGTAPSGYATLGVMGGDGEMITGDASAVLNAETSLARNLNVHGYGNFLESSPATDAMYTAGSEAPNWEYQVVYDAWVSVDAFPEGFGDAHVDFIHASPSKTGENTVTVVRDRCPPEIEECAMPDGCDGEPPSGCQYDSDCPDGELCFAFECQPVVIVH